MKRNFATCTIFYDTLVIFRTTVAIFSTQTHFQHTKSVGDFTRGGPLHTIELSTSLISRFCDLVSTAALFALRNRYRNPPVHLKLQSPHLPFFWKYSSDFVGPRALGAGGIPNDFPISAYISPFSLVNLEVTIATINRRT